MMRRDSLEGGDQLRPERLPAELLEQEPEGNEDGAKPDRGPDVVEIALDEIHPGPATLEQEGRPPAPSLQQATIKRKPRLACAILVGMSGASAAQGAETGNLARNLAD